MESYPTLSNSLSSKVLKFLEVSGQKEPGLSLLDELITAYTRHVPWESAFRIVKRAETESTNSCPRWPEEFWEDALGKGGGGTCFESNYAFYSLLANLGYRGYLTVNNMGESIGCHAAIILQIDQRPWLADVGLPVYKSLPLEKSLPSQIESRLHSYTVTPLGSGRYSVDRDRHPVPNCYTLIDIPVPNDQFREVTAADYGDGGHFLSRVIVNKVIKNRNWRFSSDEKPFCLESFVDSEKLTQPIGDDIDTAAAAVADRFRIDQKTVHRALEICDT
jgi:hypothetical protein